MVEINASSLFSRYFSESSKLVASLFEQIGDMTEDEESFICVLIDEVESLTASRKTTMGSEPTDSLRVVNVLLTQLDNLKKRPNVLVLTTSNLLEASDRETWHGLLGTIQLTFQMLFLIVQILCSMSDCLDLLQSIRFSARVF